jgi:hypothetical protein
MVGEGVTIKQHAEGGDNVRTPEEVKACAIQVASDTGIAHGTAINFQL